MPAPRKYDETRARVEPRRAAYAYVRGLIADLPRKNCWTLAQHAGDATPDKMQRLLEHASWDATAAMRLVRDFVVAGLGEQDAVVVLDESGQEKKGDHTAAVKRQYVGCAGQVANAINVVYASYVTPLGHAIVAARPYLPQEWAGDAERRAAAGVPKDVVFATKPELAVAMLSELDQAGALPPWVTGDEVYGRDRRLRAWCEDRGVGYVLGVPCLFGITLPSGLAFRTSRTQYRPPPWRFSAWCVGAGPVAVR